MDDKTPKYTLEQIYEYNYYAHNLWHNHQCYLEQVKHQLRLLDHLKKNCPQTEIQPLRIPTPLELQKQTYSYQQAIFDQYPHQYLDQAQCHVMELYNQTQWDIMQSYYGMHDTPICNKDIESHDANDIIENNEQQYPLQALDQTQSDIIQSNLMHDAPIDNEHTKAHDTNAIIQNDTQELSHHLDIALSVDTLSKDSHADLPITNEKKTPKHVNSLSSLIPTKKQLAAIAAAQRAEQSKKDKERHQQKMLEQQHISLQNSAVTETVQAITTPSVKKKSKKSKQVKPVDKDHELLDELIAQNNQSINDSKPQSDEDTNAIKSILYTIVTPPTIMITQDRLNFEKYVHRKQIQLQELKQKQDEEHTKNLKKILRAQKHEREALKEQLELECRKKFNPLSPEDYEIINFLQQYANFLNLPIDDQIKHVSNIHKMCLLLEEKLSENNNHIRFFLAHNIDTYENLKDYFLQFKLKIYQMIPMAEELKDNNFDEELSNLSLKEQKLLQKKIPNFNKIFLQSLQQLFNIIESLHSKNGILDITEIIYPYKNPEEISALESLTDEQLSKTQEIIKIIYKNCHSLDDINCAKIKSALRLLFIETGLYNCNSEVIIDHMLSNISEIIKNQHLQHFQDVLTIYNSFVFHNLERQNETQLQQLSQTDLANITKINCMIKNVFMEIIEKF